MKTIITFFSIWLAALLILPAKAETVTFDCTSEGMSNIESDFSSYVATKHTAHKGAIKMAVEGSIQQTNSIRMSAGSKIILEKEPGTRFSNIIIKHVQIVCALETIEKDANDESFEIVVNNTWNTNIKSVTITFDVTVNVGEAGFATLYLNDAANIPSGVKVYTATLNQDRAMLQPIEGSIIPAGTGVILQNQGSFTFTHSDETANPIGGNVLVGAADKKNAEDYDGTLYALGVKEDILGFYRLKLDTETGKTPTTPYKSYLLLPKGSGKPSVLTIEDEESGISAIYSDETSSISYDLSGRKIKTNARGLSLRKGAISLSPIAQ